MRRDRSRKPRRKVCSFCVDHAELIDYKDTAKLRRFTTERGKILPRRISGVCAKHQRKRLLLSNAHVLSHSCRTRLNNIKDCR